VLEKFVEWNRQNAPLFHELSIDIEIHENKLDNVVSAMWVIHTSKTHIGGITVWQEGLFEIEIVCLATEKRALYMSCQVNDNYNMDINDMLKVYKTIMMNN